MKKMGDRGRPVRLGIIGVGGRGYGQMMTLLDMPDVRVAAVCDCYPDRVERAQQGAAAKQGFTPDGTADFRELNRRDDLEAVVVMSSWTTHARIAIDAMQCGKRAAMEVGGASSVEECWQLVRTSEATGMPCMLLENCCYGLEEMTLLNMVRQGLFGEIVQERKPPPIDVYDTASWMVITALSEQSVAMGGLPVPVPDFTDGAWINRGAPDAGLYSLDRMDTQPASDTAAPIGQPPPAKVRKVKPGAKGTPSRKPSRKTR